MQTTSVRSSQPLRVRELRTLLLASLGSALEFYDFVIFVFFAAVIGKLFFAASLPDWVRQTQTFGIFAAGYLARPLGGIVMAHFGDTRGRKRMFTLSVLLMAIPTLLIGLLPTYQSIGVAAPLLLLAMRVMQGIAIGGEAPGAWVFVAEHARRGKVGFAVGSLTSGLSCGILLGSLVATGITLGVSQAQIANGFWRVPFVIGGAFGFIAMLLRRWLAETPVFEAMRARAAVSRELPLRTVLRSDLRPIVLSVICTWMLTASIVVVILMTPFLLQSLFHLAPQDVQLANLAGTAALCLLHRGDRCRHGPVRHPSRCRPVAAAAGRRNLRSLRRSRAIPVRPVAALPAGGYRSGCGGAGPDRHGPRISSRSSVHRRVLLVQRFLRRIRWNDSATGFLADPLQPAQRGTLCRSRRRIQPCGDLRGARHTRLRRKLMNPSRPCGAPQGVT